MKKIIVMALCALSFCMALDFDRRAHTFSVCMTKFKNHLFCEAFTNRMECESEVVQKVRACQAKYKDDPIKLTQICHKMEKEESIKCYN